MTERALPPGPVEFDDEGNDVPQPAKDSDVALLIQVMEWGRKKGFAIGPMVRIGSVTLQIQDLRQQRGRSKQLEPEPTIWEEHGFTPEGPTE